MLHRVEPVEWCYDGRSGKIIKWTLERGNDHDDPSVLAYLVGMDGEPTAQLMNGQQYNPGGFAGWLEEAVATYEKRHPRTAVPFVRTAVDERTVEGEATWGCEARDEAREAGRPVALYFGRDRHDDGDKTGKREVRRARRVEKGALDSKKSATAAEGWTLLRFDLSDADHRAFAATLGVSEAPTLLLEAPGNAEPVRFDYRVTSSALASALKKLTPAAEPKD